jgi:hypothetical protein
MRSRRLLPILLFALVWALPLSAFEVKPKGQELARFFDHLDVERHWLAVDNLTGNWAYMVMGSLAWTLKAWSALLLPEKGRWAQKHRQEKERLLRMEFATFVHTVMQIPCQIVRTARRIIYRFLSWNPWQSALLRLVKQLRCPLRC